MYKSKYFKKVISLLICAVAVMPLTGCELVPTLRLTDDESHIIAEYSAGLLLKYDRNYKGNLSEFHEEEPDMKLIDEYNARKEEEKQAEEAEENGGETAEGNGGEAAALKYIQDLEYADVTMADALGLSDFNVSYSGYELSRSYPTAENSTDLMFSMEARDGKELLVLHFDVTNLSGSTQMCDVLDKDTKFRVLINGNDRVPNQFTILPDDLCQYHNEIEGNATVDTVLIFEIESTANRAMESLDFVLNYNNKNSNYKIF